MKLYCLLYVYNIINRYIASMPRSMLHYYTNVGVLKHTAAPTFDIVGEGLKPLLPPGSYAYASAMARIGVGTGGQGAPPPPISKDIVLFSYIDYY